MRNTRLLPSVLLAAACVTSKPIIAPLSTSTTATAVIEDIEKRALNLLGADYPGSRNNGSFIACAESDHFNGAHLRARIAALLGLADSSGRLVYLDTQAGTTEVKSIGGPVKTAVRVAHSYQGKGDRKKYTACAQAYPEGKIPEIIEVGFPSLDALETSGLSKALVARGIDAHVTGVQTDGSEVACVSNIADASLARTTAANDVRAAFAQRILGVIIDTTQQRDIEIVANGTLPGISIAHYRTGLGPDGNFTCAKGILEASEKSKHAKTSTHQKLPARSGLCVHRHPARNSLPRSAA